jgi:Flp pilus assembly protein TadG
MKQQGQGLVEMAIITPILIFILIGVFEVGWALRGYLVLINANREAARFAVRQDYLNFAGDNIGYEKVWTHTLESISGQIDYNENTGAMIVSYINVVAPCTMPFTVTTPLDVPTTRDTRHGNRYKLRWIMRRWVMNWAL